MAFFPLSALDGMLGGGAGLGAFGAVGNPYQLPAPRLPSGFGGPDVAGPSYGAGSTSIRMDPNAGASPDMALGGPEWQRGVEGSYTGGQVMTPYGPGIQRGSISAPIPSLQMGAGNPWGMGQGPMPLSVFGRGGFANLGGFAQLLQQLQQGRYSGPMPGQGDPNRMVPNGFGGVMPAWQAEQMRRMGAYT